MTLQEQAGSGDTFNQQRLPAREPQPAAPKHQKVESVSTGPHPDPVPALSKATLVEFIGQKTSLELAVRSASAGTFTLSAFSGDTGSSGNMTGFLAQNGQSGGEMILVDCAVGRAKLKEKMRALGLTLSSSEVSESTSTALKRGLSGFWLEHLLVTHLHSDHFKDETARACLELGIKVHIPRGSREALLAQTPVAQTHVRTLAALEQLDAAGLLEEFAPGQSKRLGIFQISCQAAMHDIPANCYLIQAGSLSAFHSGDTGAYTQEMFSLLERAHVWLGDGNYATDLIDTADRNPTVLERTKAVTGHMGNDQNGGVLQTLSRGANSNQLQAAVLLHKSDATNYPNKETIIEQVSSGWDSSTSQRYSPAIIVADKGPQFLFTLRSDRKIILPTRKHNRSPSDPSSALLEMGFGETGLSMRLGRDLEPELSRMREKKTRSISEIIHGTNLGTQLDEANVLWRVPGKVAVVTTTVPQRTRFIAPITTIYNPRTKEFFAYISENLLGPTPQEMLCELALDLSEYIDDRRVTEVSGDFVQVGKGGRHLVARVPITEGETQGLTTLLELALLGGSSRLNEKTERTQILWIVPERLAVLITDTVVFPRIDLGEVLVAYDRERERLFIEVHGVDSWKRHCEDEDDVVQLLEAINTACPNLKIEAERARPDEGSTRIGKLGWKCTETGTLGGILKYRERIKLTDDQLKNIAAVLKTELLWG